MTAAFFEKMVMPRSRSSSFESMMSSLFTSLPRFVSDCLRSASTRVDLPWSTCAMMAMFRMSIKRKAALCAARRDNRRRKRKNQPIFDVFRKPFKVLRDKLGAQGARRLIIRLLFSDQRRSVPGHLAHLVGRHDRNLHFRFRFIMDEAVAAHCRVVLCRVEHDAERIETAAYARTHDRRALPHRRGKSKNIRPAPPRNAGTDIFLDFIDKEFKRELRARVAVLLPFEEIPDVAGRAAHAQKAALFVQECFEFVEAEARFFGEINHGAGVDVACPRRHRKPP